MPGKSPRPKLQSTQALSWNQARHLVERRAGKAAGEIHVFEKAEEIALRIKDATALEKALIGKLESERDFAAQYMALFPRGVNADRRAVRSRSDSSSRSGSDTSTVGSADEWCLSFGFNVRTVRRWCELLNEARYVERKSTILKRCWELAELWQSASYSSASNEWYTPPQYLEAVREVFGQIDLDPASCVEANTTVQATEFFSKEDDGLAGDWFGRVFLNPPYGKTKEHRSLAAAFCNKAIDEFAAGKLEACIILVNSLHSQSWQAPLYDHVICLVDHRIHFVSGDGEENENPTNQNIFVYLGHDIAKFAEVFSRFGYVMRKIAAPVPQLG
jgi:phage N-6-adenine-methyltransferase